MKYEIAVFDMDGTILNTIEDLADSMNYCLDRFGLPQRSLAEVTSFVGNGIHRLVELAVPEGTEPETVDEIFAVFMDYYKDHCAIKTRPYEGICQLLRQLREAGVKTAVVSNKADAAVKSLCLDYFPGLFDYSVGEREGRRRKPAPDSVNAVLDYFRVDKSKAVYIGDSEVDYRTAENAKTDVIMVGWGFRTEDFLHSIGVEEIVREPEEIFRKICE